MLMNYFIAVQCVTIKRCVGSGGDVNPGTLGLQLPWGILFSE